VLTSYREGSFFALPGRVRSLPAVARAAAMIFFHFPCVEGGLVRSLCGAVHAHVNWTTVTDKVTCPRCRTLLQASDGAVPLPRRPPLSAEAGIAAKPNVTAKSS
jgi:hypothetical protein